MKFFSIFFEIFFEFFWSSVSRIVPKNVKEGPLGVSEHPFFCKIGKNEGGTFGDIKKIAKKSITKPKKPAQKIFVEVGLEPTSFCLTDLKKAVTSMPKARVEEVLSVAVRGS